MANYIHNNGTLNSRLDNVRFALDLNNPIPIEFPKENVRLSIESKDDGSCVIEVLPINGSYSDIALDLNMLYSHDMSSETYSPRIILENIAEKYYANK